MGTINDVMTGLIKIINIFPFSDLDGNGIVRTTTLDDLSILKTEWFQKQFQNRKIYPAFEVTWNWVIAYACLKS